MDPIARTSLSLTPCAVQDLIKQPASCTCKQIRGLAESSLHQAKTDRRAQGTRPRGMHATAVAAWDTGVAAARGRRRDTRELAIGQAMVACALLARNGMIGVSGWCGRIENARSVRVSPANRCRKGAQRRAQARECSLAAINRGTW
jgi:hypothetical protein